MVDSEPDPQPNPTATSAQIKTLNTQEYDNTQSPKIRTHTAKLQLKSSQKSHNPPHYM
jgi:hypothetical protein